MTSLRGRRLGQAALLLAAFVLPAVSAYNSNGKRWFDGSTTFYTGLPGISPSGTHWSAAFEAAMQQWSDKTSFKFIANKDYLNPCNTYSRSGTGSDFPSGPGDLKNGVDFRSTVCGNDWGSGVLAITLTLTTSGQFGFEYLQEADILFNDTYKWDVYSGAKNSKIIDFGRTALHELGHALGLGHELTAKAIMAAQISDFNELQPDDIAGAESVYGKQTLCRITTLSMNHVIKDSLGGTDCRVNQLFGGGSDDSFVDVYRLSLAAPTRIFADMRSPQMDAVLVLTDSKLRELDIFDDYLGSCNAHMDKTLPAGEYLLLANTYAKPAKCGSNVGSYTLTVSDSQPVLGETRTTSGVAAAATLISGGASADGGLTYPSSFTAQDSITVSAHLALDPVQIGQSGKIFVLAQLSDGSQYSKNSSGQFVPYHGDLSQMASYKSGPLAAQEQVDIIQKLRAEGGWLAGLGFVVYVGYALDSKPADIQYGSEPIRFNITR
jgi:hypothetical protein